MTPKTSKDAEKYEIKAICHIGAKFHDISRYIFETIERSKVKIEQENFVKFIQSKINHEHVGVKESKCEFRNVLISLSYV